MVSQRLRKLAEGGEQGRRTVALYIRCGTVLLAALQAYGVAMGLDAITGIVTYPSLLFRLSTVLTLIAGTLFLTWLAEQITIRGIGNGIALLLIAGVLAEGPQNFAGLIEASHARLLSQEQVVAMVMMAIAFTAVVVAVERARRLIWVRFAARQIGDRHIEEQSAALAFKLNPGGIIPALVASWLLLIVLAAVLIAAKALGLHGPGQEGMSFAQGQPFHLAFSAVVIIVFAFVYTAFLHDPERVARQLEAHDGTIAEHTPDMPAADYLDDTLSRMTAFGAVYLTVIMLLPVTLAPWLGLPFAIGGTSLLVLACLTLDIEAQVRALLSMADAPVADFSSD
jgi:preprotein translocase subunit SecY